MKKNFLESLPHDFLNLIRLISQEASRKGLGAYVVGGFVRDLILGRENLDLDIVIEGDAIELAKGISQKCRTDLIVYPHFGTATLIWKNKKKIDLASARKERYLRPGALPSVSPGTIHDDLTRRDFTINALAVSLNQDKFGTLVDVCDGLNDLRSKKIRVFHEQSFMDDPTRILRAVRFEQRLDCIIEEKTKKWLLMALGHQAPARVSPGRYFEEFKKILQEPKFEKCLKRLAKLGGLKFFDPAMTPEHLPADLLRLVRLQMQWFENTFPHEKDFSRWIVIFMVLIDSIPMEAAQALCQRLCLSRKVQQKIFSSKTEYEVICRLEDVKMAPSQIYKILNSLSLEELIFFLAKSQNSAVRKNIRKFLSDYRNIMIESTGRDLLKMGLASGPHIRSILRSLLYQKIDGIIKSRDDERKYLYQFKESRGAHGKN